MILDRHLCALSSSLGRMASSVVHSTAMAVQPVAMAATVVTSQSIFDWQ